jgi:hypothetical protein
MRIEISPRPRWLEAAFVLALALSSCGPATPSSKSAPNSIVPVIGPGGDPTTATDRGAIPEKQCGDAPVVKLTPSTCQRPSGTALVGGGDTADTTAAFDGDVCSIWAAGGPPPRFAGIDFGVLQMISGLVLVPEMAESGLARHVIEASDDGITFHTVYILEASMEAGHVYEVKIPAPFGARALRVSTTKTPGWVAWREIVPLTCK